MVSPDQGNTPSAERRLGPKEESGIRKWLFRARFAWQ